MHKIDTSTATADREFTDGNASTGVKSTKLNASWFNTIQRELCKIVTDAGLNLDASDDSQLSSIIAGIHQWKTFSSTGSSQTFELGTWRGNSVIKALPSAGTSVAYPTSITVTQDSISGISVVVPIIYNDSCSIGYRVGSGVAASSTIHKGEIAVLSSYAAYGATGPIASITVVPSKILGRFDALNVTGNASVGGNADVSGIFTASGTSNLSGGAGTFTPAGENTHPTASIPYLSSVDIIASGEITSEGSISSGSQSVNPTSKSAIDGGFTSEDRSGNASNWMSLSTLGLFISYLYTTTSTALFKLYQGAAGWIMEGLASITASVASFGSITATGSLKLPNSITEENDISSISGTEGEIKILHNSTSSDKTVTLSSSTYGGSVSVPAASCKMIVYHSSAWRSL